MDQEYYLWVKWGSDWEELLGMSLTLEEALEYFIVEITGDHPVKVTDELGEDVTSYFIELSEEEECDFYEEGEYDYQRAEAKAAGHFS